ncbi:MAG TPA: amidohydrolase [Longimicrobiaceae bacterium]|nr:amidohydrolase [Longimicrobiaceae bacterium]
MTQRPRSYRASVLAAALASVALAGAVPAAAQDAAALRAEADRRAAEVQPRVVAWRRDIHQHPELSNRETRTAKLVADHLRGLGMEVRTGVAHTGVVGVLRGGRPGPVVALRADMDALPVTEQTDLPFRSTVRTTYNGQEVGVMHACGHDLHTAMLMGTAQVLAGMRERIPGTVVFIFQPAEEGPPPGEEGGARLMVKEGVLQDPKPDAVFGLHVWPQPVGTLHFRPLGTMAAADNVRIVVRGKQTHGAVPWGGVDPIVVGAQIVSALQAIPARQLDLTVAPAVVTIGSFQGGVRQNIIPDSVVMLGTIRTFDTTMQRETHERVRRTAQMIAQAAGATAEVEIREAAALTFNDPELTARMAPTLARVVGPERLGTVRPITAAEDFSYYQQQVPGMFFFLGIVPEGQDPARVPANHSPHFFADEGALPVGVRAMAHVAVDFLTGG